MLAHAVAGRSHVMRNYLLRAVANNALWCDAVCRAEGTPGEFRKALWLNSHGTPPYYPDVVTLAPVAAAPEQMEAIAALVEAPRGAGWTVKDSFRSLDLSPLGFTPLFDAEWILRLPMADDAQKRTTELQWAAVRSEGDLQLWSKAWAGEAADVETLRIFAASLLSHHEANFLFALADGIPLCGGILNRGAGVVGLSNVFHAEVDPEIVWRGLLREAARRFPELPVVGYECGEELAVAQRAGLRPVGPLRIWCRPAAGEGSDGQTAGAR